MPPTQRLRLRIGISSFTAALAAEPFCAPSRAGRERSTSCQSSASLSTSGGGSTRRRGAPSGSSMWVRMCDRSTPRAFQCSIARSAPSRSTRPIASSSERRPSEARISRTSSATKKKKLTTCSGVPLKRLRSSGSCVAMPTGQVFRWQARIMMQPVAISGAVEKPISSAPSIAATTTSRPVLS